ncbi:MAG: hypothetical protein ABJE95_28540 [Byssovorax sp.]
MGLAGTAIIYLLLGLVVSTATALGEARPGAGRIAFLFTIGALFWPLFAPTLLGGARASSASASAGPNVDAAGDARIRAAEADMLAALAKVKGGVAGEAMAPEAKRVRDLASGLRAMAARIVEIEEALRAPGLDPAAIEAQLADVAARGGAESDPRSLSLRARLRNVERLRALRGRTGEDLERSLFKMEEITSQMLLLKFAGRPEAEVAELIDGIADSVEGVTEALFAVA